MCKVLLSFFLAVILSVLGCKCKEKEPEPKYLIKIEDLVGTWISIDSFAIRTDSINYYDRDTVEIDTTFLPKNFTPYLPIKPYCIRRVKNATPAFYTINIDRDSIELHYAGPTNIYILPQKFMTYLSKNNDTLTVTNFNSCSPNKRLDKPNQFNQFIKRQL